MSEMELIAGLTRDYTLMKYFITYFTGLISRREVLNAPETGNDEIDFLARRLNGLIKENKDLLNENSRLKLVIKNMELPNAKI